MFFKISLEFCVILEKPGGVPTKNGAEIILLEPDPGNAGGGNGGKEAKSVALV